MMDNKEPQHQDHDLVSDASAEIKGMAKQGLNQAVHAWSHRQGHGRCELPELNFTAPQCPGCVATSSTRLC